MAYNGLHVRWIGSAWGGSNVCHMTCTFWATPPGPGAARCPHSATSGLRRRQACGGIGGIAGGSDKVGLVVALPGVTAPRQGRSCTPGVTWSRVVCFVPSGRGM